MKTAILKQGKERNLGRHPWIYSGAIAETDEVPEIGETVEVLTSDGYFFASAAFSPSSSIRARVWSFDPDEKIDENFINRRLERSINLRNSLYGGNISACRLVYGESDGLPGLIVDKYEKYLCVQFLSAGAEHWREFVLDRLVSILKPAGIYERSDQEVRKLEGLEMRSGMVRGLEPGEEVIIEENSLRFKVDLKGGQKTGFYLDQRCNRKRIREFIKGRNVLDAYSYTGGFALNALAFGVESALAIESSAEAVKLLGDNAVLNDIPMQKLSIVQGNVFEVLRKLRDEGRKFGLIVLDPPKFAPTVASLNGAIRGYKDINLLGMKLLEPGGIMFTFSCSGAMTLQKFIDVLGYASKDAEVDARIIEILSQAPDHPVSLNFPESAYLKGVIIQIS